MSMFTMNKKMMKMIRTLSAMTLVLLIAAVVSGCESTSSGGSDGTSASSDSAGASSSGSSSDDGGDAGADLPPEMTRATYKRLKRGMTRAQLYAVAGSTDYTEGPSPATSRVDAERCYSYTVPGTAHKDEYDFTIADEWWICFNGTGPRAKLVHKERQ
jgi:hypothetical protein